MNAAYLLDRLGKTIAERDAAITRAEKAEKTVRYAVEQIGDMARELGELKGKQDAMQFVGLLDEWREKCARLETENARLREALENITGTTDGLDCQDTARAALGKDKS